MFLSHSWSIFGYFYIFLFFYFLRNIQLRHTNFFTGVFGITQRFTSPNKPFYSNSRFAGSHFEVLFGDHFWIFSLNFWELLPILSFEDLCRCFLHYSNIRCGKKNFIALFFCFENYMVFLAFFGYIPQCFEELQTISWYFAWISWYFFSGH